MVANTQSRRTGRRADRLVY